MLLKTRKKLGILILACLLILGTIPLVLGSEISDIVKGLGNLSNIPDEKWKDAALTDSDVVNKDMRSIVEPATNKDWPALSICADKIAADSQKALDNSNSYAVSGDVTKIMKDQYNLAMKQAGQVAIYIKKGTEEAQKGNNESATADFNQAAQYMKSYKQNIKFVYQSIHKEYCVGMYSLCINGNGYKCREKFNKCMDQIIQ